MSETIIIKTKNVVYRFPGKNLLPLCSFFRDITAIKTHEEFDFSFISNEVLGAFFAFVKSGGKVFPDNKNELMKEGLLFARVVGCDLLLQKLEKHEKYNELIQEFNNSAKITSEIKDIDEFIEFVSENKELVKYLELAKNAEQFARIFYAEEIEFVGCSDDFEDYVQKKTKEYLMDNPLILRDKMDVFFEDNEFDREKVDANFKKFTDLYLFGTTESLEEFKFKKVGDKKKKIKKSKKLSSEDREERSDEE